MKDLNAPNCGRETDLIGFLYGELNEVEALAFQHHVKECAACNTELAGFRDVRESVVTWRNESLGGVVLPPQLADSGTMAAQVKPSAIAALREFFNLSPLWMKGAVVFASILFCLFAGLAARWYIDQPSEFNSLSPVAINSGYSQEEVDAIVQRRVQEELARMNTEASAHGPIVVAVDSTNRNSGHRTMSPAKVAGNNSSHSARRPLSKTERQQLAADLRLISSKNDSDLDLLEDRINQ
jgi:anti-sigma factor RsiW